MSQQNFFKLGNKILFQSYLHFIRFRVIHNMSSLTLSKWELSKKFLKATGHLDENFKLSNTGNWLVSEGCKYSNFSPNQIGVS